MRTYIGTEVTLDTVVRIPNRNVNSDTTFLVCGRSGRGGTIYIINKCRYRQSVAFLSADLGLNVVNEINNVFSSLGNYLVIKAFVFAVLPALRNLYFNYTLSTSIDCCPVLHNNIFTLTAICLLSSSLHQVDCLFLRNDTGQFEECRLQNGIDTGRTHAGLDTDLNTVDGVEVDVVISDEFLHLAWQMLLQFLCVPRAVQQESTAVNQLLNHVVLTNICRVVASYEVCFVDQVGGFNLLMTVTQVGHGNTTGFLGVIIKICLCIHVGVITDDLDGVLVSTYGTICTQAPELTVGGSFRSGYQRLAQFQRQIGNIINDTQSEFLLLGIAVYSNNLCRSGILGT